MSEIPNVYFGPLDAPPPPDWRDQTIPDYDLDDDEELEETPADVVEMLGFDPKKK